MLQCSSRPTFLVSPGGSWGCLTLALWGVVAVVIGLILLGVGVVPIAMLATLLNGMWAELGMLAVAVVLTYGFRTLGAALADAGA